ncbi:MAG: hypothetical protein R3E50_02990 [Halioglobus sp.]
MGKRLSTLLLLPAFASLLLGCSDNNDNNSGNNDVIQLQNNILVLTDQMIPRDLVQQLVDEDEQGDPNAPFAGEIPGGEIAIVKLRGKTNHFGVDIQQSPPEYIDYHATVPQTKVWIAEYPYTRDLDIQTDDTGWWTMYIVKDVGVDLEFSFVYEKEDWITTKTNVNEITDEDNLDYAIQYIDPYYFTYGMLPFVEGMMRNNGYPNFFFANAMVVTVGKSWASMHDDRLPHGDPGATMTLSPTLDDYIGPIYFNRSVIPDLSQPDTSVDGGVTWLNMPVDQTYYVSAIKPGVTYPTVRFRVTSADVENGVQLYIASPPDSLEGDNSSPPGDP